MDEEDDAFLKSMNRKRDASTQCSEKHFEEVMYCFEETTQVKQPYASVDSPPVLSYDEIESSMDDYLDDHARPFAKDIYEHWKTRRLAAGNRPLVEGLKVSRSLLHLAMRRVLTSSSSKQARILMMLIHTSASGGGRSDRFARRVVETLIVLRNSRSSGKSLKRLVRF